LGALYAATLFLSAALLFGIEPLVGKRLLPDFGGTPAVWNGCMVFFQATLLAGYLYAHVAATRLGLRKHAILHVLLVLAAVAVPVFSGAHVDGSPLVRLLAWLTTGVGLPAFLLSSTAPLLQRWWNEARPGADPYWLYAASNTGSMLALFAYPLLVEPMLGLSTQQVVVRVGLGVFAAAVLACAGVLLRAPRASAASVTAPIDAKGEGDVAPAADEPRLAPPDARRRLRWVALSAIPSSLLLGLTSFVTTDVAPVPLFWTVPLAVYLATFIFVFGSNRLFPPRRAGRVLPWAVALVAALVLAEVSRPLPLVLVAHLGVLFVAAMALHGELAADRPAPTHLTEFYLWMSVGGVLGGVFNALVAPLVFTRVVEYPLAIVLACVLAPRGEEPAMPRSAWILPVGFGAGTGLLAYVATAAGRTGWVGWTFFGLLVLLAWRYGSRPRVFASAIAATVLVHAGLVALPGETLVRERSFYGTILVSGSTDGSIVRLVHGGTTHGQQNKTPELRGEPLTYFARTGPVGDVFMGLDSVRPAGATSVAVVGLGAGTMACYRRPGEAWTYFELDPAMVGVARGNTFTFVEDHFPAGEGLRIVLGDARLELAKEADRAFDLFVLDAFSSDAIPVHLLTREALALYRRKLRPGGFVALHVSNRYLELRPVVAKLAADAGWRAWGRIDRDVSPEEKARGKQPSSWIVTGDYENVASVVLRPGWEPLTADTRPTWTDDFSNVLGAVRW
jgi:SAM-dependent methyltransferase